MTSRRRVRPGRGQSRASALYGTVVEQLRAYLSDRVRAAVGRHCSLVDSGAILRGHFFRLGLSAAADSKHFCTCYTKWTGLSLILIYLFAILCHSGVSSDSFVDLGSGL